MSTTLQDLRYAIRLLARTPGFTAVAVLTLALGIGANTAIFTVVNAVVFKPLPYPDAERLVMVWQDLRARSGPEDEWLSPGNYADLRAAKDIVGDIAVMSGWRPTLLGGAEPEPVPGEVVSYEYFSVVGMPPALGRNFEPADDVPNAARVVVISDAFWKKRFGGDRAVVGKTLNLSGESHEIIGVMPAGFRPVLNQMAELWRPIRLNLATPSRGSIFLRSVAKLPDGRSIDQAHAAATALSTQLQTTYPRFNEKMVFNVMPLKERVVGDVKAPLLALLGAVGFVLLIACANIANLLLARGSARGRELAVRVALGAGRARVARQLLTESLVLAAIGGVAGVLFGIWGTDALVALAPENTPRLNEIGVEPRVLGFAALVTLLTGLIFGLAPAVQAARGGVTQSLKDGARGGSATGGRTLRRALVGVEVALALVLLTGGLLLLQTFVRLQKTDLGFSAENILIGFVSPPRALDTAPKLRAFYDQIFEKVRALPGVQKAALTSVIPLGGGDSDTGFRIEGRPEPQSQSERPVTWYRDVSASYFDTMGIKLVKGRLFEERDPTPSVVVNETFAQRYFPGEEAIGQRLRFSPDLPLFTIIGIVGDVKMAGALEPKSRVETYVPYWHFTERGMAIVLKSPGNPTQLVAPLRQAVAAIDRDVPVSNVTPLSDLVRESIDQPRFIATLAAAFAILALTLAAIGIYGVMAYSVSQRMMEFGVRLALGAARSEVFRLVLRDALTLTVAGVVVGVGGSYAISRALRSLDYGITTVDPLTLAMTSVALVTIALIASIIPARRATRVDPMVALRSE
jgi:putative ABC transport system permease protein